VAVGSHWLDAAITDEFSQCRSGNQLGGRIGQRRDQPGEHPDRQDQGKRLLPHEALDVLFVRAWRAALQGARHRLRSKIEISTTASLERPSLPLVFWQGTIDSSIDQNTVNIQR
jgi:hypothetical protein